MPPMFLIADDASTPDLIMEYNYGDNVLDTRHIYTTIKRLSRLLSDADTMSDSSTEFLSIYWHRFAFIVDYFADFASHDTPTMQSVWFHLVDVMQGMAGRFSRDSWIEEWDSCEHPGSFARQYIQTITFLQKVIEARLVLNYDAFISGLMPWQQFLLNGSPGFGVPKSAREYLHDDPFEKYPHSGEVVKEQHVPFGALGIIAKHTERLRSAAISLATATASDDTESRTTAEALEDFDSHVLQLGHSFSYTSLTGHMTIVQHMHPSPTHTSTTTREPGYIDDDCEFDEPSLNLIDDCVAMYKGEEAFVHPKGVDKFHMWSVSVLKERGGRQGEEDGVRKVLGDLAGLDMFQDWKVRGKRG